MLFEKNGATFAILLVCMVCLAASCMLNYVDKFNIPGFADGRQYDLKMWVLMLYTSNVLVIMS